MSISIAIFQCVIEFAGNAKGVRQRGGGGAAAPQHGHNVFRRQRTVND